MNTRFFRMLGLGLALALASFAQDAYTIDATHSQIGFRIRHLVAKTSGRFTKFTGTIRLDEKDFAKSSVEVTIDAASINTDSEGRDKHLRNADFFEVEKFPTLTFKSTAVKEVEKGKLQVTGTFTMHGVSKTITIPIIFAGTRAGMKPGSTVAGFVDGSVKLNRSEYGIKTYPGVLGEEVDITLDIEAFK